MIHKLNRGLPTSPTNDAQAAEAKLKEVADLYEKHFLREMVKSMRSTIPENGLVKVNAGEKLFQEQLDNEYVESWGKQGGIGIGDLIYKDLLEKYGERLGLKAPIEKVHGPIELRPNDQLNKLPAISSTTLGYTFKSGDNDSRMIMAPWDGKISRVHLLENGSKLMEIEHGPELKTRFNWKGDAIVNAGQSVKQGESIGYLGGASSELNFNIIQK